jgi:hypothetical protein
MAITSSQLAQEFHDLTPLDRGTAEAGELQRHEDMTPRIINLGIREVSFTPYPPKKYHPVRLDGTLIGHSPS